MILQTLQYLSVDNAAAADYGAKSKNGMGDFGVTMHSQGMLISSPNLL